MVQPRMFEIHQAQKELMPAADTSPVNASQQPAI